jgi:hypothetical protein
MSREEVVVVQDRLCCWGVLDQNNIFFRGDQIQNFTKNQKTKKPKTLAEQQNNKKVVSVRFESI